MERKDVKLEEVSPMMREYLKTKSEYEGIILFYRLGDFYEMFFDDAITASHELELTLTGKQCGLKERVPMCGVPHHAVNIYLEKLIEKGYKVAICEQMEDPKTAKGIVKREVIQIVSAGTLTSTEIVNEKDFNYIASITDYNYLYVLSYADLLSGKVYTTKIEKNNDKLISHIVNLNIKEIVVRDTFDVDLIHKLKSNYNIFISYYDNDELYKGKVFENVTDQKLIKNTSLLLNYLTNSLKQDLGHIQQVEVIDSGLFLELDKECIKNLELVETIRNKDRQNSLLGFMDKTKTAMGSRLLKSYIISPSIDKTEIIKRQNLVEKLMTEFLLKSELKEYLYEIYDLERLTGKVVCSNLNARDLLQLKTSIKVIPDINNILETLGEEKIETFNELYLILENSIKDDVPLTVKDGGIIKEGYDKEVDELRSIKSGGKDFISNFEREEKERTGIKGLKIGYNKVFGYYIEVPKGQISQVKEEFHYDRKQTISNCERYITPLLKEKENLILNAEEKLNTLEYDIFCKIKEEVKRYIPKLQKASAKIAYYDVMQSFATIAEEHNFVKPTINENSTVEIIKGRHPVVESVISTEYIDNDIIMNENTNILIITGPNMSGKSTYMREFGIIAILNQIGSFVPASKCNLPVFDKIFTRIGASDDLVGGESTFMVEMKESAYALENATKNSLILFDELGRGTSTYDGMSLAGSIIDYIATKIRCKTLFSTHYHELTDMENKLPGIHNVHVSIDETNGDITFLHKVMDGAVDKSYGINVAKLANLPHEVIKKANELLKEYESKSINTSKTKIVKQYTLDLEEEKKDELREFIKGINVLNITPLEAINLLDEIKRKSDL
ncbi:dNA mismatch repair protein MutS [Clostridium sp. CAG:524]|jgi:DNA mismatch repair protein MutS|nr:DNA mismatch repair protein MutS [Clostridium sp.]CDA60476.1 dNA mismatch repair protein MutS [Clostridium sp. CAG:524]